MKRKKWGTGVIIGGVILFAMFIIMQPTSQTSKEIVQCIGENSIIYVQLGCHACETQEKLFGENYEYLNIVDCWFERDTCVQENIQYTPTWIIRGEKYQGVQSIEKLKELTDC